MRIEPFLEQLDPARRAVRRGILARYGNAFAALPGSLGKHQVWPGGLMDYVIEVMNIACMLHGVMDAKRRLPFSVADTIFVLFLHDHDKLGRYTSGGESNGTWVGRCTADQVRDELAREHAYTLTADEYNALRYVHGEGADYSPERRMMGELAAFVHCCDTISARIWYAQGQGEEAWTRV